MTRVNELASCGARTQLHLFYSLLFLPDVTVSTGQKYPFFPDARLNYPDVTAYTGCPAVMTFSRRRKIFRRTSLNRTLLSAISLVWLIEYVLKLSKINI